MAERSEHTTFVECEAEFCTESYPHHRWGSVRANSAGWFISRKTSWCPEHVPDWVPEWRRRKRMRDLGYNPFAVHLHRLDDGTTHDGIREDCATCNPPPPEPNLPEPSVWQAPSGLVHHRRLWFYLGTRDAVPTDPESVTMLCGTRSQPLVEQPDGTAVSCEACIRIAVQQHAHRPNPQEVR